MRRVGGGGGVLTNNSLVNVLLTTVPNILDVLVPSRYQYRELGMSWCWYHGADGGKKTTTWKKQIG